MRKPKEDKQHAHTMELLAIIEQKNEMIKSLMKENFELQQKCEFYKDYLKSQREVIVG
jgi:hypothetical protein